MIETEQKMCDGNANTAVVDEGNLKFLSTNCRLSSTAIFINKSTKPRMLCNGNGILLHLQMRAAVMGFVEDFRYGLHNS